MPEPRDCPTLRPTGAARLADAARAAYAPPRVPVRGRLADVRA